MFYERLVENKQFYKLPDSFFSLFGDGTTTSSSFSTEIYGLIMILFLIE